MTSNAIRELVQVIRTTGVMNCEFIMSDKGRLCLMDINPRFSAGVSFSKAAGCDFVKSAVECAVKDRLTEFDKIDIGKMIVKRYVDFISQPR